MKKLFVVVISFMVLCVSVHAKTYSTELVIIGSGIGGLTSAGYAGENGIKTILVEKLPAVGGQLMFLDDTFAVGSPVQIRENIYYDPKETFNELMAYHQWFADVGLVKNLVYRSGSTIQWLNDRGIIINHVTAIEPNGKRTAHRYASGNPGKPFIDAMMAVIKKSGNVTVMTETKATRLLTDKTGAVIGIEATDEDGEIITINSKAVLVATGSFVQDKELLLKYNPGFPADIRGLGLPQNMGDGIKMGQAIGADVANMNVMVWEGAVPPNMTNEELMSRADYLAANVAVKNPSLFLNKNGRRFVNEEHSGNYSVISNALTKNGHILFMLMDEPMKQDLQYGSGAKIGYYTYFAAGQRITSLDDVFKVGPSKGFAWKANTVEEVARLAGLDPVVVRQSVDRYNALAEKGDDEDMGKSTIHLKPIKKGPFYIVRGDNTICDGAGGLKVNENSQVYHVNGTLIKGLYATGSVAGGKYGPSYSYITPGFASASAMNGGFIAIDHASGTLMAKKNK